MPSATKATALFTGAVTLEEEAKVLQDYVVGQRLGEGAYGSVYVAKYIPSGESFALKILQKQDLFQTYADSTGNEAVCLAIASSAGVSSPLGVATGSSFATVMTSPLLAQQQTLPQGVPVRAEDGTSVLVPPATLLAAAQEQLALVRAPSTVDGTVGSSFAGSPLEPGTGTVSPTPPRITFTDNPFDRLVVQEAAVMQSLEHPHVVKLYKFLNSTVAFYFIMELAEGGELFDLIISKQYFSEDEARHYFQQLISAIDYCHRNGIAHKDLKAENLLLAKDGRLLVCDFGFSSKAVNRNVDDPEEAGTAVETGTAGEPVTVEGLGVNNMAFGTLHYMSPEAVTAATSNCPLGGFEYWGNNNNYLNTNPYSPRDTNDYEDGDGDDRSRDSDSESGTLAVGGYRRDHEGSDGEDTDGGYYGSSGYGSVRPTSFTAGGETYVSPYAQLRAAALRASENDYLTASSPIGPMSTGASTLWATDGSPRDVAVTPPLTRTVAAPGVPANRNTSFGSGNGKEANATFNNSSGLSGPPANGTSPTLTVTTPALSSRPSALDLDAHAAAGKATSAPATGTTTAVPALTQPSTGVSRPSPTTRAPSLGQRSPKDAATITGSPAASPHLNPSLHPRSTVGASSVSAPGCATRDISLHSVGTRVEPSSLASAPPCISTPHDSSKPSTMTAFESGGAIEVHRSGAHSVSVGALDRSGVASPATPPQKGLRPAEKPADGRSASTAQLPHASPGTTTSTTSVKNKLSGQLNAWMKSIMGEKPTLGERGMRHSTSLGSLSEMSLNGAGDRASLYNEDGSESDHAIKKKKRKEEEKREKERREQEKLREKEAKKGRPSSFASHPSSSEMGEEYHSDAFRSGSPVLGTGMRGGAPSSFYEDLDHYPRGPDLGSKASLSSSLQPAHVAPSTAGAGGEGKADASRHKNSKGASSHSASKHGPSSPARWAHKASRERTAAREAEKAAEARAAAEAEAARQRRRRRKKRKNGLAVVDPYQQDLWSAGVILYFMLTGRLPFDGRDDEETQHLIGRGVFSWTEEEEQRISPEARRVVKAMLAHDPTDRPTLDDIIASKWFVRRLNIAAEFPHREEELRGKLVQAGLMSPVGSGPHHAGRRGANGSDAPGAASADDGPVLSSASSFLDFSAASHVVTESEEQALATAFQKIDTDGYGKITRDELRDMMTTLHGDVVEQSSISELVNLFTGAPDSKEITFKQFRDAWVNKDLANIPFTHSSEFQLANIIGTQMDDVERVVVRQLREAFDSVDTQHTGVIESEELRGVFDKCHIPVQDEDLRSLVKFFHEKDMVLKNNGNLTGGVRLVASPSSQSLTTLMAGGAGAAATAGGAGPGTGSPANASAVTVGAVTNSSFTSATSKQGAVETTTPRPASLTSHATTTQGTRSPHPPPPLRPMSISFDAFVMGIVHREILLRHPLGRKLAAATNLTALFHSRNVTECVRHGFLVAGLQNVVLEKLSSVPERLLLLYSDEVVSNTENIYSFRYLGSSALVSMATMESAGSMLASSTIAMMPLAPSGASANNLLTVGSQSSLQHHQHLPLAFSSHSLPGSSTVRLSKDMDDDGLLDFGDQPHDSERTAVFQDPEADRMRPPLASSLTMRTHSVLLGSALQQRHLRARRLLSVGAPHRHASAASNAGSLLRNPAPTVGDFLSSRSLRTNASTATGTTHSPRTPAGAHGAVAASPQTPAPLANGAPTKTPPPKIAAPSTMPPLPTSRARRDRPLVSRDGAGTSNPDHGAPLTVDVTAAPSGTVQMCSSVPVPLPSAVITERTTSSLQDSNSATLRRRTRRKEEATAVVSPTSQVDSNASSLDSNDGESQYSSDRCSSSVLDSLASTHDTFASTPCEGGIVHSATGSVSPRNLAHSSHQQQHHHHHHEPHHAHRQHHEHIEQAKSGSVSASSSSPSHGVSPVPLRTLRGSEAAADKPQLPVPSHPEDDGQGPLAVAASPTDSVIDKASPVDAGKSRRTFPLVSASADPLPVCEPSAVPSTVPDASKSAKTRSPSRHSSHLASPVQPPSVSKPSSSNTPSTPDVDASVPTNGKRGEASSAGTKKERKGATRSTRVGGRLAVHRDKLPPTPPPLPLSHQPPSTRADLTMTAVSSQLHSSQRDGEANPHDDVGPLPETHPLSSVNSPSADSAAAPASAMATTAPYLPPSVIPLALSTSTNMMATSMTHRTLAFGGGGAVPQVNGVCDVDVILAPACLGYTLVRFRRIHGKTSDFHEAVTYISNLLDFERQQAVEDTMPRGESELM